MSNVVFNNIEKEKKFLVGCLSGVSTWKNIPDIWISDPVIQKAYKESKKFLQPPYSTSPTFNLVEDKTEDPEVKLLLREIQTLQVDTREQNVIVQDLFDMFSARRVYEVALRIPEELEKKKVSDIIRDKIVTFSELMNPLTAGTKAREFIYDSAVERWLQYKRLEEFGAGHDRVKFHIKDLDDYTNGGLQKSHIMCLIGGTGDGKTFVKLNLAYNFAFIEKVDTMVITLEVPASEEQRDYQRLIDSRHSLMGYSDITNGTLNVNRAVYREKLIDIKQQEYPLYIVDIPDKATPADVISELELYFAKTGKYPEVVVLDYVNEMEPIKAYSNTSEKFKNLGVELRRITRSYGIRLVTSMQLNREGKKMKNGEKRDLEHVSESHYFSNVCHVVAFLYRDEEGIDEVTNQLHWTIRKNRYGKKNVTFTTFFNPVYTYVGDRKIEYAGILQ